MNWGGNSHVLGHKQLPDDAVRDEGFKDGDWMHEVFFQYLIKHDLPNIMEVVKRPRVRQPVDDIERVRAFAEQFIHLQPA